MYNIAIIPCQGNKRVLLWRMEETYTMIVDLSLVEWIPRVRIGFDVAIIIKHILNKIHFRTHIQYSSSHGHALVSLILDGFKHGTIGP